MQLARVARERVPRVLRNTESRERRESMDGKRMRTNGNSKGTLGISKWRRSLRFGKDLFPYLKVPLDVRCLGMTWNHWNIISAELPTIYVSERFPFLLCTNLYLLRMCFESKVNIWLSKHHIQNISVALGLFSILFSPISKTGTFMGGFIYGNESLHDGFALFP